MRMSQVLWARLFAHETLSGNMIIVPCLPPQLPQDREALLTHFHTLKQEMNVCRESERNALTTLTLQSDAAIKQLERKKDKVQSLV